MSTICFLDRKEGAYNERVTLTSVDLDRVDNDRLVVDRVSLNDRHVVPVDREGEVRVARHRNKAETVTRALGDVDDRKVCVVAAGGATQPIEEGRVLGPVIL